MMMERMPGEITRKGGDRLDSHHMMVLPGPALCALAVSNGSLFIHGKWCHLITGQAK